MRWLPAAGLSLLLAGCHRGASLPPAPPGFQIVGVGNPPKGTLIYDAQGNLAGKVLGLERMHHFTDGSDDGPAIKVKGAASALWLSPFRIATTYYAKVGAAPAPLTPAEIALAPNPNAGSPPPIPPKMAGSKTASGSAAASGSPLALPTVAPIPISTLPPPP